MKPINTTIEDAFVFQEEEAAVEHKETWKVLLVDDEPEVHNVTKLALDGFQYDGKYLEMHSAFSAKEAREMLAQDPGFAMAFVDVVMETDDAGLQLVKHIRQQLGNLHLRIILRTGQPGMAPERFVIENYDIDDYKAKTDMTAQKLITTVVGSLRAYKEIKKIEKIVEERTSEIREKNKVLSVLNRDLTDSIIYARRIQEAILPLEKVMQSETPKFAVYYEPKDIVSGDFYWVYHRGDEVFFAVVDCTGHGVPGAFMAVLGYSLLNQVMALNHTSVPGEIITMVDQLLRSSLRQNTSRIQFNHDGMDMGLCVLNKKTKQMMYAAARRPLYIFRQGNLTIVPGTRCSIGAQDQLPFESYNIPLQPGDICYMFTDGATDQFGGTEQRKLMPRRFKEMLQDLVQKEDFSTHQEIIAKKMEEWRAGEPQTDDVLVMGMMVV